MIATKKAFVLPVHSYSLKVLEKLSGYKISQDEYGRDWAMAQYIKAVETNNESKYNELMKEILLYNKEDLEATWAVMQWLFKQDCKNGKRKIYTIVFIPPYWRYKNIEYTQTLYTIIQDK